MTYDSHVEWIGEIPEEWLVSRIKVLAALAAGGTPKVDDESFWDEEGLPWIAIGDMSSRTWVDSAERGVTPLGVRSKSLPVGIPGTILFAMYASVGEVAVLGIRATWNQAILGITPVAPNLHHTFLMYWLVASKRSLERLYRSNTQSNLNAEQVGNLPILSPALAEQRAIADFLDRETSRIDTLIVKRQRIIGLLDEKRSALISQAVTKGLDPTAPMRDSGIEWIGEIPEGWDVNRLRFHATIKVSNVDKKTIEGEFPIRLCNYTDVYYQERITDDLEFMVATATASQKQQFALISGDVLLTKDSETAEDIGVSALVVGPLRNVVLGYHLALLRGYPDNLENRFLHWQLKATIAKDQLSLSATGVTRFGLRQESIASLQLILPPLTQQHAIADFLDRETSRIDQLKSLNLHQIELLKEKRQALITAAVTGKIPEARGVA